MIQGRIRWRAHSAGFCVRASSAAPSSGLSRASPVTKAAAAEIGASAFFVPLDVTQESSWSAAIETVLQHARKLDVLVNSAADWGKSDPLKTRKVADAMLAAGFTEDDVDLVLWRNPVALRTFRNARSNTAYTMLKYKSSSRFSW